jgi:hypothetical protein
MLTKPSSTPLADIVAAKKEIYEANKAGMPSADPCNFYWKLVPKERELQQQAFAAFAKLNGWSPNPARWFGLNQIAGCAEGMTYHHRRDLFDHCLFARAHCRPAALIAQPYVDAGYTILDEAREIADRLGLALHVPPAPKASIHYVGGCVFLVFTSREHSIRWLPEMVSGVGRARRMYRIVGRAEEST